MGILVIFGVFEKETKRQNGHYGLLFIGVLGYTCNFPRKISIFF